MLHILLRERGGLERRSELGGTLPYNHGSRCSRPATVLRLKDSVEEVGGCDEAAFGWVAGLEGVGNGLKVMSLDHVGLEGAEEDIKG